jgi:hypothetical protein
VFMRIKTNPQPFTMRLCLAFVNCKTENCAIFALFFLHFSYFVSSKPNSDRRFSQPRSPAVCSARLQRALQPGTTNHFF